jgi:putative FmdB family regulatory protein
VRSHGDNIQRMRTYAYECRVCSEHFSLERTRSDRDGPAPCLRCRTPFGQRVLTAAERSQLRRLEVLPRRFMACG